MSVSGGNLAPEFREELWLTVTEPTDVDRDSRPVGLQFLVT